MNVDESLLTKNWKEKSSRAMKKEGIQCEDQRRSEFYIAVRHLGKRGGYRGGRC